ncbi:MAG: hypothetical protein KC588_13570 [Nitrospira sp.]|nr:hypothetical protein [Nitrospira sp.]
MPASFPTNRSHAVVIGCSFAGLLAARILSDHFERVTIFERDPVHDYPEARRGQAQTRHLHGLLAQGFRLLNRLFPHLESTLVQGGAVVSDMGESIRWYHHNGYKLQFPSGLSGVSMSRVFLEWEIRKAVLDLPNVTLRASCTVSRLVTTPDRSRVVGVELASEEHQGPTPIIQADFVVNTGGRGSATGKWLEGLGYSRPREEEITVGVGYATRIYRRRPDDLIGANLVMTSPTPPYQKHMAFLFPMEQDRWIVSAGGWLGDHPPTDDTGYREFLRNLPVADVFNVIQRAEPLSDVYTYKFHSSLRRRYERLNRFPEGYFVLGDAVASFNPIYGQGMTSAAMQADALDSLLRRGSSLEGLWRSFFRKVAKVVDIPWQIAGCEDFRYPETQGRKPPMTDLLNGYLARVHRATHHDSVVYLQFLRVMNLMASPVSLLHPRIMRRVLL